MNAERPDEAINDVPEAEVAAEQPDDVDETVEELSELEQALAKAGNSPVVRDLSKLGLQ